MLTRVERPVPQLEILLSLGKLPSQNSDITHNLLRRSYYNKLPPSFSAIKELPRFRVVLVRINSHVYRPLNVSVAKEQDKGIVED